MGILLNTLSFGVKRAHSPWWAVGLTLGSRSTWHQLLGDSIVWDSNTGTKYQCAIFGDDQSIFCIYPILSPSHSESYLSSSSNSQSKSRLSAIQFADFTVVSTMHVISMDISQLFLYWRIFDFKVPLQALIKPQKMHLSSSKIIYWDDFFCKENPIMATSCLCADLNTSRPRLHLGPPLCQSPAARVYLLTFDSAHPTHKQARFVFFVE